MAKSKLLEDLEAKFQERLEAHKEYYKQRKEFDLELQLDFLGLRVRKMFTADARGPMSVPRIEFD